MIGESLPLWSRTGFNASVGASYERLLADGTPDTGADIRVRVQARQMFVYAMASYLGWSECGRGLVERIDAFVERTAVHPETGRGYVHLLDPGFKPIDRRQDLYDHAFFILAYAWCYRAWNDRAALDKAAGLVEYLDEKFKTANGGWREGDYPAQCRRQNPHMHLFEAFLALFDATADRYWLERAGELFELFETRFYDASRSVLFEYFDDRWSVLPGEPGRVVEPGHMMEWVWLLRGYGERAGVDVSAYADALYDKALAIGVSSSGLLFDAVTPEGQVVKPTKRCWPMTEYIKASVAQARAGRAGAGERAAEAVEKLFEYYLCASTPGAYIDLRGSDDKVALDVSPASTLYHLIVAAAEVAEGSRRK